MSEKDKNDISSAQQTGHAEIQKEQRTHLQNSGSTGQRVQPEGPKNQRDSEGQEILQATNLETTHPGELGDVSSSSPRSKLPSGHSREGRVNEGGNTNMCTGEDTVNEGSTERPITPPTPNTGH